MDVDGWVNLGLMLAESGKNLSPFPPSFPHLPPQPLNDAGVAEARYRRRGRESVHIRKGLGLPWLA